MQIISSLKDVEMYFTCKCNTVLSPDMQQYNMLLSDELFYVLLWIASAVIGKM